jgi:glutathione S-transferase
MALDSEHHGGLWDLPETVLSGASDLFSVAHAALAEHPWVLANRACYAGLLLVCILAAARVLAGPKASPRWARRIPEKRARKEGDATRARAAWAKDKAKARA